VALIPIEVYKVRLSELALPLSCRATTLGSDFMRRSSLSMYVRGQQYGRVILSLIYVWKECFEARVVLGWSGF